jgi:phospholipase C
MIAVSPWSRGGWVNSQLFDHTSVIRFLEQRFGVMEPNISAWRRAVTGDLTSAFDFTAPDPRPPALPGVEGLRQRVDAACKLGPPQVPARAGPVPRQEPGTRPARPLPYLLNVRVDRGPGGGAPIHLIFENRGAAGAHFLVTSPGLTRGPWFYTVDAGKTLSDRLAVDDGDDLTISGPDGFLRQRRGEAGIEAELSYAPATDEVVLSIANTGAAPCAVMVRGGAGESRRHVISPSATSEDRWSVRNRAGWYDLSVSVEQDAVFLRRFAGHLETGRPSSSDPAIGAA